MCFARPQVFCQLIARNHLLDTFCQVDQTSVLLVCEYLSRLLSFNIHTLRTQINTDTDLGDLGRRLTEFAAASIAQHGQDTEAFGLQLEARPFMSQPLT